MDIDLQITITLARKCQLLDELSKADEQLRQLSAIKQYESQKTDPARHTEDAPVVEDGE